MPDVILDGLSRDELIRETVAAVVEALRPMLEQQPEPMLVDGDRMAEMLSISRSNIDRLRASSQIPSVMVGKRRLYEPQKVIDALAEASAQQKTPSGG